MAEPTLAEQMVTKYRAALPDAPAGVEEVTVDGNRIKLADLKRKCDRWKRQYDREQGTRPRAARIVTGDR